MYSVEANQLGFCEPQELGLHQKGGFFLESQLENTDTGERQPIAILAALAVEDARILHLSKRIAWNVMDANNGDFYAGHHSCNGNCYTQDPPNVMTLFSA